MGVAKVTALPEKKLVVQMIAEVRNNLMVLVPEVKEKLVEVEEEAKEEVQEIQKVHLRTGLWPTWKVFWQF